MFPGMAGLAGPSTNIIPTVMDVVGPSAFGTAHSFSNVHFGPDSTGRVLLVYIFGMTKNSATTPGSVAITSWLVGGVGNLGGGTNGFYFRQGGSGSTVFCGAVSAGFQPVGSSGTISFTTGISVQCSIVVVSTTTIVTPLAVLTNSVSGNNASATSVSTSVDLPTLATMTSGGCVNDTGITTSFTNNNKLVSFEHVAGYQCAVAASFNLPSQVGRSITFSESGTAHAMVVETNVWQ